MRISVHRSIIIAILLLAPLGARAQVDAIIDAVVDAVEPTPVYDTDLTRATEKLADKIERLNKVLFGGAEETSAAYRYRTMYSDLYQLTTTFSDYVQRSYTHAQTLERMYSKLDGESTVHDYAKLAQRAWNSYETTVRNGSRIVEQFKRIFSDPNTTNSEIREAAKEAIREMEEEIAKEEERVRQEMETTEIADGLLESAKVLVVSPEAYAEVGRKTYGTTVDSGRTARSFGSFGTAIIFIIALMCVAYTITAGVHLMKGTVGTETFISRLLFLYVISIIIILVVQQQI